jgi:hypothetical protein
MNTFFEYNSEFKSSREKGLVDKRTKWQDFYKLTTKVVPQTNFDPFAAIRLRIEEQWFYNKRPYYNIYPSIISCLTKVSLEKLSTNLINLPLPELLLRFPENSNHPLRFWHDDKEYVVRTIMVGDNFKFSNSKENFLIFWIDVGEIIANWNVQMFRILCKKQNTNVEDAFSLLENHPSSNDGIIYPADFIQDCARLVCSVCLMSTDPEIVQPEVLSIDEIRYEKTKDPKYIEKAINRGKLGWNFGKNIDISPHVRAACPAALYWTGPGKTIPTIRFRKGSIVHKNKLSKIPTGYLDE